MSSRRKSDQNRRSSPSGKNGSISTNEKRSNAGNESDGTTSTARGQSRGILEKLDEEAVEDYMTRTAGHGELRAGRRGVVGNTRVETRERTEHYEETRTVKVTGYEASFKENALICALCSELLTDPRRLDCLHVFCFKCIEKHCSRRFSGDKVPCPICQEPFVIPRPRGLSQLPKDEILRRASQQSRESMVRIACEVCLEEAEEGGRRESVVPIANKYCERCNKRMCEQCSAEHRHQRSTRRLTKVEINHQLSRFEMTEEVTAEIHVCQKHKDAVSEFYCYDCRVLVRCAMCLDEIHRTHRWREIVSVAIQYRREMEEDERMVLELTKLVRMSAKRLRREQKRLNREYTLTKEAVLEQVEEVKRLAELHGQLIISQLESIQEQDRVEIERRQESFELSILTMETYTSYSKEVRTSGRHREVAVMAEMMHNRAIVIKNTHVIESDYQAPDISFISVDLNWLLEVAGIRNIIGTLEITDAFEKKSIEVSKQVTIQEVHTETTTVVKETNVLYTFATAECIWGITLLDYELYMLRHRGDKQLEKYNTVDFQLCSTITIPDLQGPTDMVSCSEYHCIYISNSITDRVHRVELGTTTWWPVGRKPRGLSVTASATVIVTCSADRVLMEFGTRGDQIREIQLCPGIINPLHGVLLKSGLFVVIHGQNDDEVHRICLVDASGEVVSSYGENRQLSGAQHISVDVEVGAIIVADCHNRRVIQFSASLEFERVVLSADEDLKWWPARVVPDWKNHKMFVAENDRSSGVFTAGRAIAFKF